MTYALALSEDERARYRLMAEMARSDEGGDLIAAGLRPGVAVADVGCGPGATLRLLAREVGTEGRADGVDRDPAALTAAAEEVAGLPQASVRVGEATDTGLPPASYDLVICRHVLAHNGGAEAAIVAHLADLARPGGSVYLVDVDVATAWIMPQHPDLADLDGRYREYHRVLGNDLTVGRSLGTLLEQAGLEVRDFRSGGTVRRLPVGIRPPAWAAREALRTAGLADEDDLARWDAAFVEVDAEAVRPWGSMPICIAVGRRGGA